MRAVFKINDKFEFLRRLNGKVRRICALEDAIDVIGRSSEQIQIRQLHRTVSRRHLAK